MKNGGRFYVVCAALLMGLCGILLTTKYFIVAPAIPVALLGFLLLYRYPEYGVILLAFLVPLEGLFAGNKLFTGSKFIGVALIAIIIVKLLTREIAFKQLKTPLWWPILLLVFAFSISSAWSPYPELSIHSLRQLITAISIFFITLGLKDRISIVHFMKAIVISVAITAFLALVSGSHTLEDRAIGLLTDPNYFALLLTTAMPLVVYLILQKQHVVMKLAWCALLVLILITFQKTLSRSGVVVLVIACVFLGYHYKENLKKLSGAQLSLIFIGGMLAAMLSFMAMPEDYRDRILSLANITSGVQSFDDRSLGRRTSYIVVGFNAFKDNPIIGTGPGTFPVHYAKSGYATAFSLNTNEPELFRRAHNTYLETLTETGLTGFVALCCIILTGLMQFKSARKKFIANGQFDQATLVTHAGVAFLAIALFFMFL
ncbi:MAG: O-antigen ligase family protein, partial [Pseudomonadales bacterium]|nr:O-antigen ligase family protein [Pseudomonadales bacterium]